VRFLPHLAAGVSDGDGESAISHYGQIDDIVPDEGSFIGPKSFLLKDFPKYCQLVLDTLMNVLQFQVAGS
jgi:hypothetical protein